MKKEENKVLGTEEKDGAEKVCVSGWRGEHPASMLHLFCSLNISAKNIYIYIKMT